MGIRAERKAHRETIREVVVGVYQKAYEAAGHDAKKAIVLAGLEMDKLCKARPQEKALYAQFSDNARATLEAMIPPEPAPTPQEKLKELKQRKVTKRVEKGRHNPHK